MRHYLSLLIAFVFRVFGFMRFIVRRFQTDQCLQSAGSLTYTTLLSLVPLITIALTLVSAFPVFSDLSTRFKIMLLSNLLPDFAGKIITVYMRQFSDNAARLTAVGIISLCVTALLTMYTIDAAFNSIWRVHRRRAAIRRFLVYWAVLTLGPLLIGGSLSASSWLWSMSRQYLDEVHWAGMLALNLTPLVLSTLAFTLIYQLVPRCYVPARHAFIAGLVAAICFLVAQDLFGLFINHFNTYKLVYGAFASLPVFLVWVYMTWVILLGGAEICASLDYWRNQVWQRPNHAGQTFVSAVQALIILEEAHQYGASVPTIALSERLHIGWDELLELLEVLQNNGYIEKTAADGWLLARTPERILFADLFRVLVWPPTSGRQQAPKLREVEELLNLQRDGMEKALRQNLKEFIGSTAKQEAAMEAKDKCQ